MYYVYVLKSLKDKNIYIGCTKDLANRLNMHNSGKIESTQYRRPFKVINYEAFIDKEDAFKKERWLKTGWGRNYMKRMLHNSLKI